jgi:prephenate dehydratase
MERETVGMRVGYQGLPGAHSEEALASFLPEAKDLPFRTLPDVFAALETGEIDRAFIPVENSHAGSVAEAWDLMVDHAVTVLAERVHPVSHYLLGLPGAELREIRTVYSHPQALSQSAAFLRQAGLVMEPYYDTAGAAQMVAERRDPQAAAVASRLAGERYGLNVLAESIQTSPDNATRFFLLSPGVWSWDASQRVDGPGKTSLAFATDHRPGALVRALTCFARQHINLARLESRPSRRQPWEYLFFADLESYAHEPRTREAIRELARLVPMVRVLGSYPVDLPRDEA